MSKKAWINSVICSAIIWAGIFWFLGWAFAWTAEDIGKNALKIAGAQVASFAVHEGGHYLAAKSKGIEPHFHDINAVSYTKDGHPTSDNLVSMAGLGAQVVADEAVLAITDSKKRGLFWDAFLTLNALKEIGYPIFMGDSGDFRQDFPHKNLWKSFYIAHGMTTLLRTYYPHRLKILSNQNATYHFFLIDQA